MAHLAEIDYFRTGIVSNQRFRRQLLQWAHGWTLSQAAPEGVVKGSMRYYAHGTNLNDSVFKTRSDAEQYLAENGWKRGDSESAQTNGTDRK